MGRGKMPQKWSILDGFRTLAAYCVISNEIENEMFFYCVCMDFIYLISSVLTVLTMIQTVIELKKKRKLNVQKFLLEVLKLSVWYSPTKKRHFSYPLRWIFSDNFLTIIYHCFL